MIVMLFWIFLCTLMVSLIGLIGVFSIYVKEKTLRKITLPLVAFSAGALLSTGLFHLLLESLENLDANISLNLLMIGFLSFFFLEKFINWHHCHEIKCKVHTFSYLLLVGDFIHNFIDGLTIAASFIMNFNLGLLVTFAIILHEIPQEMGSFAILLYGGFNRKKAILFKFLAQVSALIGGLFGLFSFPREYISFLLPFAAGGFIYISSSDLIPKLSQDTKKRNLIVILFFIIGIIFLILAKQLFE